MSSLREEGFLKDMEAIVVEKNITMNESIFINLLFKRVEEFQNPYPEEFWSEIFGFLSECGWIQPELMSPDYIVDNISINGEIRTAEEAEEYGVCEDDCLLVVECEDETYYVLSLGL